MGITFPQAHGPSTTAAQADAALLLRLGSLAHECYRWKPETYAAAIGQTGGRDPIEFPRVRGVWRWRVAALGYMPISYFFLVFSFGAWILLALCVMVAVAISAAEVEGVARSAVEIAGSMALLLGKWVLVYAGALAASAFVMALRQAVRPDYASAQAFGFLDAATGAPVLVFVGSKGHGERRDDLNINACAWPMLGPMRHLGFHRAWRHIRPSVMAWLATLPPDAPLTLTGHSLGGALAQIAAYDLGATRPVAHVVSFGSSRIGSAAMRRRYQARLDPAGHSLHSATRHIRLRDDAIPRLPPALFFKHVGVGFVMDRRTGPVPSRQETIFGEYVERVRHDLTVVLAWTNARLHRDPAARPQDPRAVPSATAESVRLANFAQTFGPLGVMKLGVLVAAGLALTIALGFVYYGRSLLHGLMAGHSHAEYVEALQAHADRLGVTPPSGWPAAGSA